MHLTSLNPATSVKSCNRSSFLQYVPIDVPILQVLQDQVCQPCLQHALEDGAGLCVWGCISFHLDILLTLKLSAQDEMLCNLEA